MKRILFFMLFVVVNVAAFSQMATPNKNYQSFIRLVKVSGEWRVQIDVGYNNTFHTMATREWATGTFVASETDPNVGAHIKSITTTEKANWNTAFGWGNHAGLYPLLAGSYTDPNWLTITKAKVGLSNVPNLDATNPSNIGQSSLFRFVTDAEKTTWNSKVDPTGSYPNPSWITTYSFTKLINVPAVIYQSSYYKNWIHPDSNVVKINDSTFGWKMPMPTAGSNKISIGTVTRTDSTILYPINVAEANFTGIPESAVTNLVSDLALKSPLASPTFTGTPAGPTASAGTNTTQLATTAHVFAERANTATLTNKTIDGDNNTLQDIPFTALKSGTIVQHMIIAVSDETTDITTGTAKVTFRMPYAATITAVRASLATASSSGIPTVDINEAGTTILSTKLTIDATEKTSTTAATAAVISDSSIADDAEITIDIDVAGTGAKGLKIIIYYTR
jgi:hypothetical protein